MVAFLLGAGFDADATIQAGRPETVAYPLSRDLLMPCFGLEILPQGLSVEDLFQKALDQQNRQPILRLVDRIMDADHKVGWHLLDGERRERNAYTTFLQRFPFATFITFNYDSLLEMLLLSLGRWRPDDGYGVRVRTNLPPCVPDLPNQSTNLVLHLHGTLCVFPEEYRLTQAPTRYFQVLQRRDVPLFSFDPDAIAHCFGPFSDVAPKTRYHHLDERIIVPVPDKAAGLAKVFVRQMYDRAIDALGEAEVLIVIGYRFGPHDHLSYRPLLRKSLPSRVVVVSPDALSLTERLKHEFPSATWEPVPHTFAGWVYEGFPGVL